MALMPAMDESAERAIQDILVALMGMTLERDGAPLLSAEVMYDLRGT